MQRSGLERTEHGHRKVFRSTRFAQGDVIREVLASLLTAVVLLAPPASGRAAGGSVRIELEADPLCRFAVVVFDRAALDESRLKALMRLWDEQVESWTVVFRDPPASPCFESLDDVKAAIPRMEGVLARFDAEMAWLSPPASLEPVVRWTKLQLEFELWQARAELDWCVTKNAAVLRRKFRDVDPAKSCSAQIERVSSKWFGKCKAGCFEWGNCVNEAFDARFGGEFPREAWEAFLRASRITLQKVECDEP